MNMFRQILFIIFGSLCFGQKSEQQWEETAELLNEGLNVTVNPCDNFIEYVCGSWFKKYGMKQEMDAYKKSYKEKLITATITDNEQSSREKQLYKRNVYKYYSQCQQESKKSSSYERKKHVLRSNFHSETPEQFTSEIHWMSYLTQIQQNWPSVSIFFNCQPSIEKVDEGLFAIFKFSKREFEKEPTMNDEFIGLIKRDFLELNEFYNSDLNQTVKNVIKFEKRLTKFQTSETDDSDETTSNENSFTDESNGLQQNSSINCSALSDIYTLNELKSCFEELEIYSKAVLNVTEERKKYFSFKSADEVVYFRKLFQFLNGSDRETVAAYIFFTTVKNVLEMVEIDENDTNISCIQHVIDIYAPALLKIYFDFYGYNISDWKNDINLIWESITSTHKLFIQGSDWLNDEEKLILIDKTANANFYPGIPDWMDNDSYLNSKTVDFQDEEDWQHANLRIKRINYRKNIELVLSNNPDEMVIDDTIDFVPNAAHFNNENRIVMNMGSLFPPWYHPKIPLAVKYAVTGYTLGHELMHGFDKEGIGKRVKEQLSDETMKRFGEKQNCLQLQYENYCYPNNCIDGKLTMDENIADIDGLKLAYMAYQTLQSTKPLESPLKHLHNYVTNRTFRRVCAGAAHQDH